MTLHAHSIQAYRTTDFGPRERAIVELLRKELMPLTDREIAQRLGFSDLNAVRPRITALIQRHVVAEAIPTRDAITGKTVRCVHLVVRIREDA